MSDTSPGDPPKPRIGRRAVRQHGQPMTAAERQARRRRNLVDLAEADDVLAALRSAGSPDANAVWHAKTRCL